MRDRVREEAGIGGFVHPISPLGRSIESNGAGCTGRIAAQAGERAAALCQPRPTLRPGWQLARAEAMGRADLLSVLGRERQNEPAFSFFLFPGKLKMQIGSKEK